MAHEHNKTVYAFKQCNVDSDKNGGKFATVSNHPTTYSTSKYHLYLDQSSRNITTQNSYSSSARM